MSRAAAEKAVIAVGHAALDRIYRIEAFPPRPTKVRALEHIESGGGMASNAAAAVARLGGRAELWSRTGADAAGGRICAMLAGEGVDVSHVMRHAATRSATAAIIVDAAGERMVVSERDHAMPMAADWLPLERVAAAGSVISDLSWIEATLAVFERARSAGVPTIADCDIGGSRFVEAVLPATDYVICSQAALAALFPEASAEAALSRLLAAGPAHAGVTRGAQGYLWRRRDGNGGAQAAYPAAVTDTTGAGDAFHGAFAWALAQGLDDAECARIAAATAALKCRALGARLGLPTRDEVEALLSRHDGRGLPQRLAATGGKRTPL